MNDIVCIPNYNEKEAFVNIYFDSYVDGILRFKGPMYHTRISKINKCTKIFKPLLFNYYNDIFIDCSNIKSIIGETLFKRFIVETEHQEEITFVDNLHYIDNDKKNKTKKVYTKVTYVIKFIKVKESFLTFLQQKNILKKEYDLLKPLFKTTNNNNCDDIDDYFDKKSKYLLDLDLDTWLDDLKVKAKYDKPIKK